MDTPAGDMDSMDSMDTMDRMDTVDITPDSTLLSLVSTLLGYTMVVGAFFVVIPQIGTYLCSLDE